MNDSPVLLSHNITDVNLETPPSRPNTSIKSNRIDLQLRYCRRFGNQEMAQLLNAWSMKYEPLTVLIFDKPEEAERWSILDNILPPLPKNYAKYCYASLNKVSNDDDSAFQVDYNYVPPVHQLTELPSDDESILSPSHDRNNTIEALSSDSEQLVNNNNRFKKDLLNKTL